MKIVINKHIPFEGYVAINLFGILFVREENKDYLTEKVIRHETIHSKQIKEMLYIFFYVWYGIEWLIKFILAPYVYNKNSRNPYYNLAFEQEAYNNDDNIDYLKNRKPYSWLKYIFKQYEER